LSKAGESPTDNLVKDPRMSAEQMRIVEKYERVISYLYPIAQSIPRKHGVARDLFLRCLLEQVDLFMVAGKSNQISKLYSADAGLAMLRFWLRFLRTNISHLTKKQHEHSLALISEPASMLGEWIKNKKKG